MSQARSRERASHRFQDVLCARYASRHRFLRSAEPDIHLRSRAFESRHRRSSLCSPPVPKQFVESLGESDLRRSVGNTQDLAVCAFVHPVSFGSIMLPQSCVLQQARSLSVADPRQADKQPSSELRRVSPDCYFLLPFLVINHSQFVTLSRCQLRGFYQGTLDMLVALFRERHTHRLVRRTPFVSAEPAIANRILDRSEA